MSWDWVVDAAGEPRVMATVLITGFVVLLLIGRYGGGNRR